jgi:hypothetical protein
MKVPWLGINAMAFQSQGTISKDSLAKPIVGVQGEYAY